MDDVARRANLHCFLGAQTCPRRPLIRVIIQQATIASQNDDVVGLFGDNGAGNVDAYIQRELITFGQETVQDSCMQCLSRKQGHLETRTQWKSPFHHHQDQRMLLNKKLPAFP